MIYAQTRMRPGEWVYNVLLDFQIQTDHLIPARKRDLLIVNKKENLPNIELVVSGNHRVKKQRRQKRDKYLDLAWGLRKLWNIRVTVIPIVIGALGAVHKDLKRGLVDLPNWDHADNSIVENSLGTEKSPAQLRRLDVSRTSVKNH